MVYMLTRMSTNLNKPFSPTSGSNLREAERGTYENIVPGMSVPIITYGGKLRWNKVETLKDLSLSEEKRDRFLKRNQFCQKMADSGEFEFAIGYAPRIKNADDIIAKGGPKQAYAAKCDFCGAGHNWVVFYKRVDGTYLGYSGVDCFSEIIRNLNIPGAEAIIENARKEESRSKKFAKTIAKINDFKRDFPGLYEHREVLRSKIRNPFARLWQAVEYRLNDPSASGVDEKWLQECQDGKFDRSWRHWGRLCQDQSDRRIPAMLGYLSATIKELGLQGTLDALVEKSYNEDVTSPFYRPRPNATPAAVAGPLPTNIHNPAQVQAQVQAAAARRAGLIKVDEATKEKARKLRDTGRYGWSFVIEGAALDGTVAKDTHVTRINEWYDREFSNQGAV